eukprot:CAMPEP_0172421480 /NCGR_PEP_ID=MMETSP1064-20121228/7730_1 /TAXON_ID=202472 /ORGANISM="Aulacoseira subarctica , Strain CCAP 1002/5" /LENGTH=174 /DNA_ID=CAMNT_0013161909 /DNA_START=107 /DNA_END=632 /DNA_ORIENTATION=+
MANDDGIAAARAKMIKERFGGQSASIGGKGSVRRNKKVASKRGATNIPEIKEVNYFKKDGRFIYHRPIEARMCEQPFWKSIWQATTECLSDAYHRRQHKSGSKNVWMKNESENLTMNDAKLEDNRSSPWMLQICASTTSVPRKAVSVVKDVNSLGIAVKNVRKIIGGGIKIVAK